MPTRAPLTVLYDADCGFCRWSVARLLAHDRRGALLPEPIQSPAGERLLAGMTPAERLASAHGVGADGRRSWGGDVVVGVLEALDAPRPVVAAARVLRRPVRWGYRQVAGRRTMLGRLVSEQRRRDADAAIARHRERVLRGPG